MSLANWNSKVIQSNLKFFIIGFLTLIMLIPLVFVQGVVNERQSYNRSARQDISRSWGGRQNTMGPILVVPYQVQYQDDKKKSHRKTKYHFVLPETLNINGELTPETRRRGIYEAMLYRSNMSLQGQFPSVTLKDIQALNHTESPENIRWQDSFLALNIQDLKGLSSKQFASSAKVNLTIEPGQLYSGLKIPLSNLKNTFSPSSIQSFPFSINLTLRGSEQWHVHPVGKTTTVSLSSPWPSPSFDGTFLPVKRTVDKEGFTAEWDVSYFARQFPQQWQDDTLSELGRVPSDNQPSSSAYKHYEQSISASGFGVSLFNPVDFYTQVERVIKYGILFFALTFLTFFIIELVANVRVHLFQYVLVGLALSLFYLLLLALSEIIGFNMAYLIAAIAIIGLITYYTSGFIQQKKQLLIVTTILSALYLYLFTLLRLEDYALLFGSLGLFVALAILMGVTRNMNWNEHANNEQSTQSTAGS